MGAGDVADGVDHNHDHQTPNYGYSGERHHLVFVGVDHHRRTPSKYQEVGPQRLCYYLQTDKPKLYMQIIKFVSTCFLGFTCSN